MSVTFTGESEPTALGKRLSLDDTGWRTAAIGLLAVRFIQGFIYWGGGSRRFIYGPQKLNPHGHWMAYKFQTAMPGALLGMDHVVAYLLNHFVLLYASVIIFSAVELIAGLMLISGLLTRAAAVVTIGLSISLMLLFGWQGATCIDEWTMAAANLAMGATLALTGSGAYSLDNTMLRARPELAGKAWFRWLGGSLPLPLRAGAYRNLALALFAFTVAFNVGTYSYYRGSVVTPFHGGPVSPSRHHFTLTDAAVLPDGGVRFHIYLDGGTPEAPAHIMVASLLGADGKPVATWDTATLSKLPAGAVRNDFAYNRFKSGPYGLVAGMGAMATVTLPPVAGTSPSGATILKVTDVNAHSFTAKIGPASR